MASLARRIVARYLTADRIGDPKDFLADYNRELEKLVLPERELGDAKRLLESVKEDLGNDVQAPTRAGFGGATDKAYDAYFKVVNGWAKLHNSGHQLFLSILQTYELPPGVRKKVEMASRAYLKKPGKPRFKQHGIDRYLEYIDLYEKFMATVLGHVRVAQDAIMKGRPHSEEGPSATKIRAGSFVLVNTGGFPAKVMDEVQEVMGQVERKAKSAGVGQVCYGEVQVTNTIHKSRALAFYLLANDELFVRANVKANVDTVHTVLHELGHRYEYKFLTGKNRAIERLYQLIGRQEYNRTQDLRDKAPKPGDTVTTKGKTYRVINTEYSRGSIRVNLELVRPGAYDYPGAGPKAHIPLEGWNALVGGGKSRDTDSPDFEGYVTEYAKRGGPSENFAEMFSVYCLGRLPPKQKAAFEELLG